MIRDELRSYTYNNGLQDVTAGFCDIEDLYKRLIKSGNAERFYSSFYSTIALNALKHFEGLSRNAATLLSTKVADCMLAHSKEKVQSMDTCAPLTKLSDQEKAGLQYIGGYVLHKLHTKHAGKSSESEQAVSILKAGKLEDQNAIECQKLTSSLNRGGLWAISKKLLNQFLRELNIISGMPLGRQMCKILLLLVLYQDLFMMLKLSQHTIQFYPILN